MNKREMVLKAAEAIEGNAVLLPDNFDHAIVGYTLPDGARLAVGVYDYDKACRPSIYRKCAVDLDLEDALLDAIRAIEGDVKPVIIHTGEG